MFAAIGQWFKRMRSMRRARMLWNNGEPMVFTDTAKYASITPPFGSNGQIHFSRISGCCR